MLLPVARHRCTLLIAIWLAISIPVADIHGQTAASVNDDPYFMPTGAKTTTYLPRVIMRNIREDRAGNIWFATFGGPIRYDGKVFTNFGEEAGLAKTRIFSLLESRSGALWFGSITGGASRFDGKSFTKFTDKDGLGNNDVYWIFEDRDANIWFGTGNGASRYDGKTMTNFTTKDGLVDNSVYAITQDASGRIWFGTQGGICSFDGKSFSNLADQVGKSFVNIRAVVVDRSGNVWFGGQEGAFRYNGKTLTTFTTKNGLLNDFVGSMTVDRAGNVWLGHPGHPDVNSGGASRYDGKSFKHFTKKDGLNSTNVYCMLEDKTGNIWFGSVDAGVCRYDGKTFTNLSVPDSSPAKPKEQGNQSKAPGKVVSELGNSALVIFQDKNNHYWFGSDGQGLYRYDGKAITLFTTKDGLSDNRIRAMQQDKSGNLFITTVMGINKFDGKTFTTLQVAADNDPDKHWRLNPDDLWFQSLYGMKGHNGPFRYDGKALYQLKFPKHHLEDDYYARNPNGAASPYDVYFIYKDRRGSLWLGTGSLGVCRYDGKSFDWLYEDHLTNTPRGGSFGIRSIIEDKEGKFWFCNTRHCYRVDPNGVSDQGKGFIAYKSEKGMGDSKASNGDDIYYMSIIEDKKGDLWMATYGDGAWRYDGKSMTHYPINEGGKNIKLYSVYQDNQGSLWLGSHDGGAYRFNGKTFEMFKP